jgi:hypothetical protein
MVLAVLGSMTVALLGIGSNEVQISRNHVQGMQAHFLAEAGLEAGYEYFRTNPLQVQTAPTTLSSVPVQAPGSMLAAHGSYTVQQRSAGDNTVIMVSTGTTTANATKVLRATITTAFKAEHAILAKRNLTFSGDTRIAGACGRIHTNENLMISGNPIMTGTATASGAYTVSGSPIVAPGSGGNKPPVAIPEINPTNFFNIAKARVEAGTMPANQLFHLQASGRVADGNGTVIAQLFPGESFNGWKYEPGSNLWSMEGSIGYTGTYYIEGDAKIGVTVGTPTMPWNASILATGDIEVSGNPEMVTHLTDTLFVAGLDAKIGGNPILGYTGLIGAHEQVAISGNPRINGYIIAENAASTSETVVQDYISGYAEITFNCDLAAPLTGALRILAWGP